MDLRVLDGQIKHLVIFYYGLFDKTCDRINPKRAVGRINLIPASPLVFAKIVFFRLLTLEQVKSFLNISLKYLNWFRGYEDFLLQ